MKAKEIDKAARDLRRSIGKKFGYKQCDYINWKIRDGYFFCLSTSDTFFTDFEVKPVFMDDTYWKAIYMGHPHRMPDSLRGNGALSHLSEKLFEKRFPVSFRKNFSVEEYEVMLTEVFEQAEKEIETFLQKYPDPDNFDLFLKDLGHNHDMSDILITMNRGKYEKAYNLAKECFKRGMKCSCTYGGKHELKFIMEYCELNM